MSRVTLYSDSGEVNWVEIDVDKEALDQDHFLAPEERFHVALALQ